MTHVWDFAARLSGCLAGVCLVLALVSVSPVRADDGGDGAGPVCTTCTTSCVGQPTGTLCKVNGGNTSDGCSSACGCKTTEGQQPNCQPTP